MTARQLLWQSMRIMSRFSRQQLCIVTGARKNTVDKFVDQLIRAGYVRKITDPAHRGRAGYFAQYQLVKNTGPKAPCYHDGVLTDGNNGHKTPCRERIPFTKINKAAETRQRLWSAMRNEKRFTAAQLASMTNVKMCTIRRFVVDLSNAGYLMRVDTKLGNGHGESVYQLIKNTGPKVPRFENGSMVDQNREVRHG